MGINPPVALIVFLEDNRVMNKGTNMNFEQRVLQLVGNVTEINAYFFKGTMFLETEDSKIATDVFFKICDDITPAVSFGKCGQSETSYDFV